MTGDEAVRIAARVHETARTAGGAMNPPVSTMAAGAWTGGGAGDLLAGLYAQQRELRAALGAATDAVDGVVVAARAADRAEAARVERERRAAEKEGG
ncbi:MAG: hypothetical protein JWM64_409 [Frankiales bacterium]|nr:hypothetical protein [Frankiales bacterium]